MSQTSILPQPSIQQGNPQDVWQKIADFIVQAEMSKQSPNNNARENFVKHLKQKTQHFDAQLLALRKELQQIYGVMSKSGNANLLQETQQICHQNQKEMEQLQEVYAKTCHQITLQCEHLNRASMSTIKTISQLVTKAKHQNVQQLQQQKIQEVEKSCLKTLQIADNLGKRFYLKIFGMITLLTMIISGVMSLYVDDQWPWEMHTQVTHEREIGKTMIKEWQHLAPQDQNIIVEYA